MHVLYRLFAALTLFAAVASGAHAGVTAEADVVVTDDSGGTLTLISSASYEMGGANIMTTADFDNFQPKAEGRILNGDIVRVRIREVESVESTFDGSLEISGADDGTFHTLLLEDLTVYRAGDGPQLSGTVVLNGEALDAADLPSAVVDALRRVLRLFHFA